MRAFDYMPFYCEENLLRLCARPEFRAPGAKVALVSNHVRSVRMRHQRHGERPGGYVSWDYHVIGLRPGGTGWEVWDFESALGLPCPAERYLTTSFMDDPARDPLFRVLDAEAYARELRSDRSHMRAPGGGFTAPPPPWPPAAGPGGVTLATLLDMKAASLGEVLTLDQCLERFSSR